MLVKITGPNFIAGVVFGEDGTVTRAAPIVKWAMGLNADQLRAEVHKRALRASYVRKLTRPDMTGQPIRPIFQPAAPTEDDDDETEQQQTPP